MFLPLLLLSNLLCGEAQANWQELGKRSLPSQEDEECQVGQFRANLTASPGSLVRLSCPLASSYSCLLATPHIQWQWAPSHSDQRTGVTTDFVNPPYFYLTVPWTEGTAGSSSGWYWCLLGDQEAGLTVTVVKEGEEVVEASTPRSNLYREARERTLEPAESTVEAQTWSPIVEVVEERIETHREDSQKEEMDEDEEEALPTKNELEMIILKYLQPVHRQLADLHSRLQYVEEKLANRTNSN